MLPEITHVIAGIIACPPGGARCISVKEASKLAVKCRPQAYGLSTEYALRRYRALKRGTFHPLRSYTMRCFEELAAQVDSYLEVHPDADDFEAVDYVVENEAPSRRHRRRRPASHSFPGFPTPL